MAEQQIKIRVKTQVEELDRLETKLERQILAAKRAGGEYKHFEDQLRRVRSEMASIPATDRLKAGVQNASPSQFMGGVNSLVTGLGAAWLAGRAKEALNFADTLGTLRDATGASAEMLQVWREAAIQTGNSAQMADKGVEKFNLKLGAAAEGNREAAQTFKDLGLEIADTDGRLRGTDELLKEAADRFKAIQDPAERARIAQKLFGDENAKLAVTLAMGSDGFERMRGEMEKFHKLLGDDEIARLDRYDKRLKAWQSNLGVWLPKMVAGYGSGFESISAYLGGFSGAKDQVNDNSFAGTIRNILNAHEAGMQAIVNIENELAQSGGQREAIQKRLIKGVEDEVKARGELLKIEQEAAAFGRVGDEMAKAADRGRFQSVGEIVTAGQAGKLRTPQQRQEFELARQIQQTERRAEELRGINPAESTRLFTLADDAKRRLPSLATTAKPFGPPVIPLPMDEQGQAVADATKRNTEANKRAMDKTLAALELGVENAKQAEAKASVLADQVVDLMRRMRNMELKEKVRIN